MSFLRHHEIYRSDVGIKTILGLGPCTASRWPAPSHEKGCGFNPAPFPSSAMSLGSAIPRQVALQQCPPPLHRPESMLYPPAETVNHHLTGAGEFSTGTLGNFQPVLTPVEKGTETMDEIGQRHARDQMQDRPRREGD